MKITVKETLEQGLSRAQGGVLKLTPGEYEATQSNGLTTLTVAGKVRSLPNEILDKLVGLELVTVG